MRRDDLAESQATLGRADARITIPIGVPGSAEPDLAFLRATTRPPYEEGRPTVTVVDLFSGCGGMTLGIAHAAQRAGRACHVPLALDLDGHAISVFQHNFSAANARTDDVVSWFDGELASVLTTQERETRRSIGKGIDFLVGGPPCQGNSDLNNKTRRNDPRNALYARMARAARVLEPKYVVIENVPAVLHDRGRVVDLTRDALETYGYRVADTVIDLRSVGVPQTRRRHVLVAVRRRRASPDPAELLKSIKGQDAPANRTVRWAIGDIENIEDQSAFDRASVPSAENLRRIAWLFEHEQHELPDQERPDCHRGGGHTYLSIYGRMRWDEPAQTITTGFGSMGQGRYVHPSKRRTITPHEAARLQCFPDFFSFGATDKRSAWCRLIGNAVPPFLTMRIAEALLDDAEADAPSQRSVAMRKPGRARSTRKKKRTRRK